MTDRRYSETEVTAIFTRAAKSGSAPLRKPDSAAGLTLAELSAIGREAGISSEAVRAAAQEIERTNSVATKLLNLPVGVERTIELPRALTDLEWDRLVVDLRETFAARGRLIVEGSIREWRSGNLRAVLEPTVGGQRLRLKSVNQSARGMLLLGASVAAVGFVPTLTATVLGIASYDVASMVVPLGATAAGLIAAAWIRLPTWARRRNEQIEGITSRMVKTSNERPSSREAWIP